LLVSHGSETAKIWIETKPKWSETKSAKKKDQKKYIWKQNRNLSDFLKQKNCHFISKAKNVKPNNVEKPIWKGNKKCDVKLSAFSFEAKTVVFCFKTNNVKRNDAEKPIWKRNEKWMPNSAIFSFLLKCFLLQQNLSWREMKNLMQTKWKEAKKWVSFLLEPSKRKRAGIHYASKRKFVKMRNHLSELQCSTVYLVLPALCIAKLLNLNIWPAATLFMLALGHIFENVQQFWALKITE
jgi:hypothetical protein